MFEAVRGSYKLASEAGTGIITRAAGAFFFAGAQLFFRAVQLIKLLVQVGELFLGHAYPHNQELPSAVVVRCRRPGSQFAALVYHSLHDLGGCQEHAVPLSKVVQVLEISCNITP